MRCTLVDEAIVGIIESDRKIIGYGWLCVRNLKRLKGFDYIKEINQTLM